MKKKFTALKMYLIGLTAGLFVFGWSTIAQSDVAQLNTTQTTANQATTSQATSNTTVQSQATTVQTVFAQPRIRTRSS
jgi:hypothetical protein